MRIFTLGKNGIPLFLFALILFSGTYSSYGQCPTVDDPTQEFCYPSTVADLMATVDGETLRWYRNETSTTPIPEDELLQDNVYYAGNAAGTCSERIPVTVTVDELPAPISLTGNFWQACLYGEQDEDIVTAANLADLVRTTNNAYFIEIFATETGGTALAATDILIAGNTYFVAQTEPDGCSSPRIAINYDTVLTTTPTGEDVQIFCNTGDVIPTVADLEASGINRWYSTATSNPALDPSTPLVHGETYYATRIVSRNDSNQPPCESVDRFAVYVSLETIFENEVQLFCESVGTGNDGGAAAVSDLSPEGGSWYSDSALTNAVAADVKLVNGVTYYLGDEDGNCRSTSVTVTLEDAPNAGGTAFIDVCSNEEPFDLATRMATTTLGPADLGGTFSPPLASGTTIFNPAVDIAQRYTYTVVSPTDCPSDSAYITVTIVEAPNAGESINETICSSELTNVPGLIAEFSSYLEGRDQNGTFDVVGTEAVETYTVFELYNAFSDELEVNPIGTFSVTYNVTNENNCTDSAEINITVEETPNAGSSTSIQLTEDPNEVSLEEALMGESTGGTWTDSNNNSVAGTLTPQEAGVFTYTITNASGCSATATVTFLAIAQDCPIVTQTTQRYCANIGTTKPTISLLNPTSAVWYASEDAIEPLPANTILVDGAVYYAGTADGSCTERPSVTIDLFDTPNAGKTTQVSFCVNESAVNLVDYITPSQLGPAQQGGTFSPALEDNIFDPAIFGPGTYSFTYFVQGNDDCPTDDASVRVTVLPAPNAGADVNESFCVSSPDELPSPADFMAAYADDNRDQTGTFSPSLETLAAAFATNPYGTFATVYSVTTNGCTDTANLSVTITQEVPADAGDNVEDEVCSTAGIQNLEDFLTEDAIPGGTFSAPYEDGTFDPSTAGTEPVVITYTVNEDVACVTGEATSTITLTVIEGPDAGEDGSITLKVTDEPVNLFDSLGGTPEEGGSWTPGNANGDLDPSTLAAGNYTYVYTVTSENGCEDTASVAVTIEGEVTCPVVENSSQSFCESILTGNDSKLPTVSDLLPAGATWYASADATEALPATTVLVNGATYFAGNSNGTCEARESVTVTLDDSPNAGSTSSATFCEGGDIVDLMDFIRPSILGDADLGGTFSPALASGTSMFDPSVDAAGTYTYTVQSTNEVCPADNAVITISITPSANAGEDFSVEFCATQEAQDLTESLPEGVDTDGVFEGLEGNIFDPAAYEVGSYEFTYTVTNEGTCESEDVSTVTVIVSEAPAAPVAAAQSFCVIDAATVAELEAEGENLLWYTDEALENLADEADALVAGTYYVTSTTEGGCESAATAVVVSFTDAATPTLTAGGDVFCEFDDPTLAEINVSGASITWYDAATGGNTLSTTEPLQNGVTYYAASTDATSACESSVRLAVTVTLEECEAIIPDAFSPNNDQINDTFVVDNLREKYPNFTIEIFNRWGNVVYKGNASTPDWDGVSTESRSLGDKVLPVGVYFYIVNFNDGQTAPTQGRLYLSR